MVLAIKQKAFVRSLEKGMGKGVARRTFFRQEDNDDWGNLAERVAIGNCSLHESGEADLQELYKGIASGAILMAGRHLQHGDADQSSRNIEIVTNCSSSSTSFAKFYLLLNGSGVGRDYSDEMMLVDWRHAPTIKVALSREHPDFPQTEHDYEHYSRESDVKIEEAKAIFAEAAANHDFLVSAGVKTSVWQPTEDGSPRPIPEFADSLQEVGEKTHSLYVGDSREGWGWSVESVEAMTFAKMSENVTYLDLSGIRAKMQPIGGMQDRPASGPLPLLRMFYNIKTQVVESEKDPWLQAMFVDHFTSKEVQVGGARRAARMATKWWKDPGIFEFCVVKSEGGLWTSNNSVLVDREFWDASKDPNHQWHDHALALVRLVVKKGYHHGEPGLINVDKLEGYGERDFSVEENFKSDRYWMKFSHDLYTALNAVMKTCKYQYIVNPCQPSFATVLTKEGIKTFADISIGSEIWSKDGWTKVVNKWSTGVKKVYQYRTSSGVFVGTANHRVVQKGQKIEVDKADAIDILVGDSINSGKCFDDLAVNDGLVFGDGTYHKASSKVYLCVGSDDRADYEDYFNNKTFIQCNWRSDFYTVDTSLSADDLVRTYDRKVPERYKFGSRQKVSSFLRGLFSANGSVVRGRITLKTSSKEVRDDVQVMLSSLGIRSYYTTNKSSIVKFANGDFKCRESYDINITTDRSIFLDQVGFIHSYKTKKIRNFISESSRVGKNKDTYRILNKEFLGEYEVFDITVDNDSHTYWTGGVNVSNCGEITLHKMGAYCVLSSSAPLLAFDGELEELISLSNQREWDAANMEIQARFDKWDAQVIRNVELCARALIRVNHMPALYQAEVRRTNRLGVSLVGIHEYAWLRFRAQWSDLVGDTPEGRAFWAFIEKMQHAAKNAANSYSDELGVSRPQTVMTIVPGGTISKIFGLTEGAHLPAREMYLRNVQFRGTKVDGVWYDADPLVVNYDKLGYPVRSLKRSPVSIVGFPTFPLIGQIGMPKVVTAFEATPEEQFEWLRRLEKYWLGDSQANQVSYTMKLLPSRVSEEEYADLVMNNMPTIKCCSILPEADGKYLEELYEYMPEQDVTLEEMSDIVSKINDPNSDHHVTLESLMCASGACPI